MDHAKKRRRIGTQEVERLFLRRILDTTPSVVLVKDAAHRYVLGNVAAARFYGVSVERLAGMRDEDFAFLSAEDVLRLHAVEDEVIHGGHGTREQLYFPDHEGIPHWWDVVRSPVFEDGGGVSHVLIIATPIDQQKEAEERLAGERAFLRLVIDTSESMITVKSIDHRFVLANRKVAEFLGSTVERLEGHPDTELGLPGALLRQMHAEERQALEERRTIRKEVHFPTLKGGPRWIDLIASPIVKTDGSSDQVLIITNDIEERKTIEERLVRSEEMFRQMANFIPQFLWLADPEGRNIYFNERWYEYTLGERRPIEEGGNPFLPYMHPDDRDRVAAEWMNAIQAGDTYITEIRFRNGRTGEYRWFQVEAVPIRGPDGRIIQWLGSDTDIEDRKRAEAERHLLLNQLRTMNVELERRVEERTRSLARSNAELEQFAYVASHDLQTPLRHVASYVELILDRIGAREDPKIAKWAAYINEGVERMRDLIQDLLQYSRVGREDVRFEEVDLDEVAAEVVETLRVEIAHAGARVELESLPRVHGVRSLLFQLFQNLLENSLKFRSPERRCEVRIFSEEAGDFWKVTVADNGIGIDPKYSDRVFTMFQRLHAQEEYPGTGIGLAICKKIADVHHARVLFDSVPGRGTQFHLEISRRLPARGVRDAA